MVHELSMMYISILALSNFTVDSNGFLESSSSRIISCTLSDLPVLLVSTVSLDSSKLVNHVVEDEQTKQWLVLWEG